VYVERSTFDLTNHVNNDRVIFIYDEIGPYGDTHGISSNISPSFYSEIENASGSPANAESLPAVETAHSPELPPALAAVFDTTPQYVNANEDAASSVLETSYSGLESSTLEPPPTPAVYDRMIQHKYVNTNPDGAASSAQETPYCGLESSTLEPPPAPAVYDTMTTPEYFNTKLR